MPVVVQGAVGLRKALNRYAPELKKQYDKELREAMKPVINQARSRVPQQIFGGDNNWSNNPGRFPKYDPSVIRRGLTYSTAGKKSQSGFVSLATLLNKSAAGAIAETAGRVNPYGRSKSQSRNPNAGQMMIERLNEHMGHLKAYENGNNKSRGRLLYAAYADNQGKALDAIMKAVEKANRELDIIMSKDRWSLAA